MEITGDGSRTIYVIKVYAVNFYAEVGRFGADRRQDMASGCPTKIKPFWMPPSGKGFLIPDLHKKRNRQFGASTRQRRAKAQLMK